MEKDSGTTTSRNRRASQKPLGWTARRKSLVLQIVRSRRSNVVKDMGMAASALTRSHSSLLEDESTNVEDDDGTLSRRRAATRAAALELVAGWSSVKMLERYVPNVVMEEIINEQLRPKGRVGADVLKNIGSDAQGGAARPLARSGLSNRRRRKSLQLQDSIRKMEGFGSGPAEHTARPGRGTREHIRVEENCTVVLADISGFTTLAEKLAKLPDGRGTEELSSKLNSYFGRMIDMIYEGGGDVVKFAGDALLVVWRNSSSQEPRPDGNGLRKEAVKSEVCRRASLEKSSDLRAPTLSENEIVYPLPKANVISSRRKRRSMFSMKSNGGDGGGGKPANGGGAGADPSSILQVPKGMVRSMSERAFPHEGTGAKTPEIGRLGEGRQMPRTKSWRTQMSDWKDNHHHHVEHSSSRLAHFRASTGSIRKASIASNDASSSGDFERDSYETVESRDTSFESRVSSSLERRSDGSSERISQSPVTSGGKARVFDRSISLVSEEAKAKKPVLGPEVIDFIGLIREHLRRGKIEPEEYVRLVHQRLKLFHDGLLDGMGDTVRDIRAMKDRKSLEEKNALVPVGGLQKIVNELALCVTVKERRLFLKYYPASFVAEEAVIWLHQSGKCSSVTEAVATGTMLLQGGYIKKLTNRSLGDFKNNSDFYAIVKAATPRKFVLRSHNSSPVPAATKKTLLARAARKVQKRVTNFSFNRRETSQKIPSIAKRSHSIHDQLWKSAPREYGSRVSVPASRTFEKSKTTSSASRPAEKHSGVNEMPTPSAETTEEPRKPNGPSVNDATYAAVHTCLRMVNELDNFEGLRLHVGIGMGKTFFMHVGGVLNRYEFVMAGEALVQMSLAEDHAKAGDLCVSGRVWDHVERWCIGHPSLKSMTSPLASEDDIMGMSGAGDGGNNTTTPVHAVFGTVAKLYSAPSERRWKKWDRERHHRLQGSYDMQLPLKLCDRLLSYIPGAVRDVLIKLHIDAFRASSLASTNVVKYDKARLFQFRQVSVLFVNLPGIDYSAESGSVLRTLQTALTCMQEALFELEGSLRQFIMDDKGTTLIGVFGLYPAHDNDGYLAVKCALNIVARLKDRLNIQAKVGVTSGTVFAAEVGNDRRCEYAVIGDIVNMSARLMVATYKVSKKTGDNIDVLCDEATYLPVVSKFRFKRLKPIMVKGKINPIRIFSPLVERSGTSKRGKSRKSTAYYGRDAEQEDILGLLDPILSRNVDCRTVVVTGDGGVGKSRFINEFTSLCADILQNDIDVCTTASNKLDKYTLYGAFRRFLLLIVDNFKAKGIDLITKEDFVGSYAPEADGTVSDAQRIAQTPGFEKVYRGRKYLRRLLAKKGKRKGTIDVVAKEGGTETEINKFLCDLVDFYIEHVTTSQLTIVVLDNLNNCDSHSVSLFRALVEMCYRRTWHLMFITAVRTAAGFDAGDTSVTTVAKSGKNSGSPMLDLVRYLLGVKMISLQPFNIEESRDFMASCLQIDNVSEFISEQIYSRTGGIALYVEELLQSLLASSTLVVEKGECRFNEIAMMGKVNNLPVPETMKGVYQEVIDRLDNDQLWILTIASALGIASKMHFSEDDLVSVYKAVEAYRSEAATSPVKPGEEKGPAVRSGTGYKAAEFNRNVQGLIEKSLLIRMEEPDSNFLRFQRKELMEVVYGKASFSVRRRIHAAYARILESTLDAGRKKLSIGSGAELEKRFTMNRLADLQKAERLSLVGNHYTRAVEAVKAYEYLSKALLFYKRLYEYGPIITITGQLLTLLSRENGDAQQVYAADESEERRRSIVLLKRDLGTVYLHIGRLDQAFPLLHSALSLCGVNQSTLEPMSASAGESLLKKLLDTWVHGEQKTLLPHKNKDFHLIFESGKALLALAVHNFDIKSFETGVPLLTKAINLGLVPKGPSPLLAQAFALAGMYLWIYFKSKWAEKYFQAAQGVVNKVGDPSTIAKVNDLYARFILLMGNLKDASVQAKKAADLYSELGDVTGFMAAKKAEGDAYFFTGHLHQSLDCYDSALDIVTTTKSFAQLWNEVGRSQCLLLQVDRDEEFEATVKICVSFVNAFSSKALKLLAGSKLVSVRALSLIQQFRSPELIKNISLRDIDAVLGQIETIKSYYSAFALCQVIEIYLAVVEAMVVKERTRALLAVVGTQKETKARHELVNVRMAFLFGSGFLIPNAVDYLSCLYPVTDANKVLDIVYKLLKRLSATCHTYRVLNPLYKRLSARFHVFNDTRRISSMKWKQGLSESGKYGMKIEELRSNVEQIRYSGKYNADISKLKNLAVKLSSYGATLVGKGAEIECKFRERGLQFCTKYFGNDASWEMLQMTENWREFESFFDTN
jgi:class 3 adenylate cyclase/tetratricopeptide (TPR) repeat protein